MTKDFDKEFTKKISEKFNEEAKKNFNEEFNKEFNENFNKKFNKEINKRFGSDINEELNKEVNKKINEDINNKLENNNFQEDVNFPFNKEYSKEFSKAFNKEFNKRFRNAIDDNIKEPEDLEEIFNFSIKKSRRRLLLKEALKTSKITISLLIVFIISVNLFPSFSAFASNLPIIGKIAEIMTFDKGIKNAVEKGLYQEINYSETKNGITLKIHSLVGDNRAMVVDYTLKGRENSKIHLHFTDGDSNIIPSTSSEYKPKEGEGEILNSSFTISFEDFHSEILMNIIIYDSKDDNYENQLAIFEIPIKLDEKFSNLFNKKNIEIENSLLETEIGKIEIKNMDSSATRTNLEFYFLSKEYDFMGFDTARLIDENGEEYHTPRDYKSTKNENFNIQFEGDLSEKKNLTFKAEGIYFARKDNRVLTLDLENQQLEENDYNIRVLSKEEIKKIKLGKEMSEDTIVLEAINTKFFSLKLNDNFEFIEGSSTDYENRESYDYEKFMKDAKAYGKINVLTEEKLIDLEIENIKKDRTGEIEFKIR